VAEPVVHAPEGWPAWPERTIFPEVARWCARWLRQPDGPGAGEPWRFTDLQARLLAWWFAYDELGRWAYRRGTIRLMKGAGKDPLAAVLSAVELCGPCRVLDGEAVPHRSPWVQVAAVSREQTKTTMRLFNGLFSQEAREEWAVDVNKEIIYAHQGRGVIEAVTSSPLSLEGGRATLTIRNEVQNWRSSNAGHDMAEVIDGNLAKSRDGAGRALSLCNAHVPGEDSVGEREWEAWQAIAAGRTLLRDVFYFALEAPPETELAEPESLRAGLEACRADSVWLDVERLMAEVWDPRTTPSEARRKYLNQVVAAEDAWAAPHEWDRLAAAGQLLEGEEVTLGFDGSKSEDWTALVACRVSDGWLVPLGIWDPARHGGEAPREAIDGAVRRAFKAYDVVAFYSDLHPWESYVDTWRDELGRELVLAASPRHAVAWDMRARQRDATFAAESFLDAVVEGRLSHSGDPTLTEHVKNARRRPNQWGTSFGKESRESSRKVDALAAAMLAHLARTQYLALPESKRRRRRSGAAMFVG
jgi:phage terminase large subunit-like protein